MVTLASVSCIFRVFIGGAMMFVKGAIIFIGKGSLAIRGPFKTAEARVNKHNLRWRLITYKLNSLISALDYSVGLSS